MTDPSTETPPDLASTGAEHADLVLPPADPEPGAEGDAVTSPAKVMRIGSMVKMLLEEVRAGAARRAQP